MTDPRYFRDAASPSPMATSGSVSGTIVFETGNAPGDYFVIYDPDLMSSNRGVWKVTV